MDWKDLVLVPVLTVVVSEFRYWARPVTAWAFGKLGVKPPAGSPELNPPAE